MEKDETVTKPEEPTETEEEAPEEAKPEEPEAPAEGTVELVYHGNPQRAIPNKRRKPSDYPFKNECGEPIDWRCRRLGILDPVKDGDTLFIKKSDLEDPTIKGMLEGTDPLYRTLTHPGEFESPELKLEENPKEDIKAEEVSITETDESVPEDVPEDNILLDALIGVKGIGKKMAADIVGAYPDKETILAGMETDELADAIAGLTEKHYEGIKEALGKL